MPSSFTSIGDRSYKQIAWGATLPPCQGHLMPGTGGVECANLGEFDSPTVHGPWADLCGEHVQQHAPAGTTIGYHRIRRQS